MDFTAISQWFQFAAIDGAFFEASNLLFEDQIETFPLSFQPVTIGKIFSG
jgi:hypothetical protein